MDTQSFTSYLAQINPVLADAISQNPWLLPIIALQILMKIIFYPIALYASAKKQQKVWFVVLIIGFLILNDFSLLPILYLIFSKYLNKAKKTNKRKK